MNDIPTNSLYTSSSSTDLSVGGNPGITCGVVSLFIWLSLELIIALRILEKISNNILLEHSLSITRGRVCCQLGLDHGRILGLDMIPVQRWSYLRKGPSHLLKSFLRGYIGSLKPHIHYKLSTC